MSRASPRIPRTLAPVRKKPNLPMRAQHLNFIRSLPCAACGAPAPNQAAHVRMSRAEHGKFNAMSKKPDPKWTVPLCERCHLVDQHSKEGEPAFWARLGIDGVDLCLRLYAVTGDMQLGLRAIERARQSIDLHRRGSEP